MISTPSFPRKRESSMLVSTLEAGQQIGLVRNAEFLMDWIPACAGMTEG
jgi:hypothetical protein